MMKYTELHKKIAPDLYKGQIEDSLQDGRFGDVCMLLSFLEWNHSDSPYFNDETTIIGIYSLLNHQGFISAVREAEPFTEYEGEPVIVDDLEPAIINKEVLKEVLQKRLDIESEKGHTESAEAIKGIIYQLYPE